MKNIIERIVGGGAKIASYLPKAVSTRLLVLALGLGLVSTAWAVAPTPTVVWDRNFADNSVVRGEDGYDYTFTLNDANNTVSDGVFTVGNSASLGGLIAIGDTTATKVTVLMKYAFAKAPTRSEVPVSLFCDRSGNAPDVGMVSWGGTTTTLVEYWGVKNESGYKAYAEFDSNPSLVRQSGYILFSYDLSNVRGYVGQTIGTLSGGVKTGINWGSSKITYVGIGGPTGKANVSGTVVSDPYPVWNGLVVEKVALFVGQAYSNTDVSEYVFPGEATYYSQWDYANDIITWTTGSSGNKDMGGNATFALFDKDTGTDTATVYTGGSATPAYGDSTQLFWYNLSYNSDSTSYKAPGLVLRVANNLATLTMGGSFGPLAFGGMIVEPGAYNNSLTTYDMTQDPSNSNRSTILGDPTGEEETLFDFNESFAINRGGAFCFPGTVNLTIHTGKSLTLSQSAKVCASITGISNNGIIEDSMISAGGVLKMHGNGCLVPSAGLDASGASLDFSDLAGRANATPFINGALSIDANTIFILPEGATSPYKVATSVTGTYPTSITIGSTTYAASVAAGESAGEIAWEINEATIAETGDSYDIETVFGAALVNTKDYSLKVEQDATLNVGTSVARAITIDVDEGKTLTLSGTSLTATTIYVTGKGKVKVTTTGMLVGTVKGDGVLRYVGVRPTTSGTDLILTNNDWKGTLCLTYNKEASASSTARQLFPQYWGSSNSKIKWNGVAGYFSDNITCPSQWILEDLLENETTYYALKKVDGSGSNNPISSPSLSGTGTFYDNSGPQAIFKFANADNFIGVINIDSSGGMNVQFGDTSINRETGKITILSGASVTIPSGSTWSAKNGFSIKQNAELTVENTQSIKIASLVGTLNIAEGKTVTLTGDGDALNFDGSGTLNVYGTFDMASIRWTVGAQNKINLYEGGVISGTGPSNGNLDLNYINGTKTIHAYGNATISATIAARRDDQCEIIVEGGKTLTCSGEIFGSYAGSIAKRGGGTLKITNASSTLPTREAGFIELATGTWNLGSRRDFYGYKFTAGGDAVIKVVQNEEDYGKGLLEICNIDSSIEHVTVVKLDTTEATLDVSAGTASMGDGTAVVGGKACTYDWEFNGDLTSVGYSSNGLSYDGFNAANSFEDSSRLYIRTHPYYDSTYTHGLWTWADDWTVAIKCTVPTTTKGMVITFGNQGDGCVGLATSENDGKVILFKAGANGAAETISEMAVSGRSTAQHLYIFSKTSDGKMKVYCDDTLIDDKSVSGLGSLPGTLQVGSLHGGVGYINLNRPANDDPATIDFVQVYNYGITDAQRSALISTYAWVNPNQYTRTVSGDESLSSSDAWTKSSDSSTVALPITDADAIITSSSSSAALTVNADFAADTLTINSGADGAALRIKAGTGTLSAAKVVVNAPVTIEYGAVDFSGSVVMFGEGGSLTYDFSGVAINSRTTRLVAKLTGLVEAPADLSDASTWPVQVITHSDASSLAACYESTFSYNTTASAYYYVCGPDHDWGSEVYYTGGYWSSDSGNTISVTNAAGATTKVFDGDTVVIPAYYPNATTWSDNTLPANVTKIRVSKSKIKVCSGANSGDIFTDVTWTIDSGCVLWFGVDSKTTSLGAMTINGTGSVECGNITINGAMSGNAPVKILDSVTTRLTSTGSIASTHTISGNASALITCAAVPPAMTFASGWAGTVELPSFAAAGHLLNNYGVSGSKIKINGITSGYLDAQTHTVQPEIVLAGDFNITDMSQRNYTFSKFSGTGDISFTPGSSGIQLSALTITELAEGYSGTVANNMANTTLNIGTLALSSGTSVVGGSRILQTGGTGTIRINAVTVGGEAQTLDLCYESDGVYVAAAEYNSVKYPSVAAAIGVATDANLADITLLNGCTTVPAGYVISENTVVKAMGAVVDTDGVAHYYVTVQAAVDDIASYYMSPQYSYFAVYGGENVPVSLNMATWQVLTFKVKCFNDSSVVVTPSSAEFAYTAGEPDENGIVTYTKSESATTYVWVGSGTSAITWGNNNNWRVGTSEGAVASRAPGVNDTVVINGGAPINLNGPIAVSVLQVGGAATLRNNTDTTFTANSIELTDDAATLTVSSVTLSRTPTTTVADSYVKLTGSTYSVAAKRTVSVSTDAHSSVDGVMDGQKFVPGDVLTITASADEYYTATLTVGGATQTSPYELTTTDADVTVAVTAVRDTVTVTIPTIPEHASVSVSFVSGGEGHTATTAGDITVDAGTDVTATWTADSGYTITAGASQTLSAVTSAQTLTAPTVEAVSQEATVSNVSFSPSANGKATVTATITGPATTATLTYGGSYYANVVNGSVTFENVSVGQTSDSYFAPTEYSLTTNAGQTTGQTSGLVDGTSWINENASTHVGGAWTNDVSYVNNKATIKDNRFEATSAAPTAPGGLVVLTMNVNFPTFSDAMVDGDAQGAITLREVNDTPTFSVLTTNETEKVWTDVTGAGSVNTNIDYVITLTFNYAANKYTAAVGGTTLSAAGGVSEFDILKNASSVQNIDFVGEGVLEYLKGDVAAEGAMVEDAQHNKYATVDAAIAAYTADKTIGPLTMLHPGSVPSGWKVVNGIISKIIKGWKLIAY